MVELPREQWTALIPDAHPGYISWEDFERNQVQLRACARARGTERAAGPAREGAALLQGIVVCGRCGRRMTVRYHSRRGVAQPDYQCVAEAIQGRQRPLPKPPRRHRRRGRRQAPARYAHPARARGRPHRPGRARDPRRRGRPAPPKRRRARPRAGRARPAPLPRRRPLNRLVADALEADWNDALRAHREAEQDYQRASATAKAALGEEQKARIRALASDLPALWSDPATPQRERKRMLRLLLEDVTLDKSDAIRVHVRFRGGQSASLTVPIPPSAWQARQTNPDTLALLDQLLDEHTDAEVAELLNQAGHRTGTGRAFHTRIVLELRRAHQLPSRRERLRAAGMLTLTEAAAQLGVHTSTIKTWHAAGLLAGHKANDKNERLYQPPTPGDPRLVKQQGRRLSEREPIESTPGGAV